ncbi:hypothetical protein [Azospirillum sp. B4]|uniref:hypothetical protein n=1 Tax=Azospirillum sp. B4 TaxID=95605 RepID=UPI00034CF5BC|nr:hypothetical protein [Azospirillum sp. B4]
MAPNTFATATKGEVIYSETSSRMTDGAILNGEADYRYALNHKHLLPGTVLLTFPFNGRTYYCSQGDEQKKSDAGLSFNSICFLDRKGDGTFDQIQDLVFYNDTLVQAFGQTADIAPTPYHVQQVPFGQVSVQSDLVFDGVKDGYVIIEHRLHPQDVAAPAPYRRKFFVQVPQQDPVTLSIPLEPFEGMSMPEVFKLPALQVVMLNLVITKADDRSVQYSILKSWAPWRMSGTLSQKGEFTTVPTAP